MIVFNAPPPNHPDISPPDDPRGIRVAEITPRTQLAEFNERFREKLLAEGILVGSGVMLTRDYLFSSPSKAALPTDGWNGKTPRAERWMM